MKRLTVFIACFIFWLLLVWKLDWQNILTGFIASVFASYIFGNLQNQDSEKKINLFYLVIFFGKMIWSWIKASAIHTYLSVLPNELKSENFEIIHKLSDDKSIAFLVMALNLSYNIIVVEEKENSVVVNVTNRTLESVKKEIENLEKFINKVNR
ncbi:MAG: Na+/H+ antiporter subunit E [Elusimicrobia bacterium]|nr:Na+/H+ antiporter subunit E [Elusimicrobiota bacterium]